MDTTTEPTPDELEARVWIYTGRCTLSDGKLGHTYQDHTGTERIYDTAPTGVVIGGRYSIECTATATRARPASGTYLGPSDLNDQELAALRLTDRAHLTAFEGLRAQRRAAKDNGELGDLTLRELRAKLARGPHHLRAGTLAAVLTYLHA